MSQVVELERETEEVEEEEPIKSLWEVPSSLRPPPEYDELSNNYYYHSDEGEGEDHQDSQWNPPRPPFFFQRLDSEEVVYKVKKKKCKFVGDYVMGDLLGEGSYGKVKEVIHSQTLQRRAVKILKKRKLRRIPNGEANVAREIRLMRGLNHPNVIKLIDVMFNNEKQKMYIVLEYCLAGLQDLLQIAKDNRFPEWQTHRYFTQLLTGLEYLHSQGVIHKDIKPGNLLLTLQETIKITDFGVAEVKLLDQFRADDICKDSQGSPMFQPPQVANGESFSGSKLDVWSSGVTLYNMTTGKYPFDGDTVFLLFENIAKGDFIIAEDVDPSLSNLIRGMLQVSEDQRFSIEQIKQHPWFRRPQLSSRRYGWNWHNWPEDMVQLPPERRKLSVLPYIINTYDEEEEEDPGDLEEGGDEDFDYYPYYQGVDEETTETGFQFHNFREGGGGGGRGYDVVIEEGAEGTRTQRRTRHCDPGGEDGPLNLPRRNQHSSSSPTNNNKQLVVQRNHPNRVSWFRSLRKFPKISFCRQS